MTSGIEVTFRVLADTKNEAALAWLISSLQSERTALRGMGLRKILERRGEAGKLEVVRHWHRLSESERLIVSGHGSRLGAALRDGLLDSDSQLNINACSMVVLRDYDQIPTLVRAALDRANPRAELAARAALALAEFLQAELSAPRDYRNRRDPALVRQYVYGCLEDSVRRFGQHRQIALVEAFLLLAPKDDSFLRHLITDPTDPAYVCLMQHFLTSTRSGVMRLILELLGEARPPATAMRLLQRRGDKPFLQLLLAHWTELGSLVFRQNLREVEFWPWLGGDGSLFATLTDMELSAAVQLIAASSVQRSQVLEVVKWATDRGGARSRRAAAKVLGEFHGDEANRLVLAAMEDPDPQVQVLAVGALRGRKIPGIRTRLFELLDSPHDAVRAAVQRELTEFTFARFLSSYVQLSQEDRQAIGPFVRRVDPDAIRLLRIELTSLSRSRRLRGLEMAVVMQVARDVAEEILSLSRDADHFVRTATVPALISMNSDEARRRMEELRSDPALAAREAAELALQRFGFVPNPFAEFIPASITDVITS